MMMYKISSQPESSVVILACDPGYDRLGVSIMSGTVHNPILQYSTCLTTTKQDSHAKRLSFLYAELSKLITKYSPSHIALETLFFSNNKKTVLKVAEARGMLLSLAGNHKLLVIEHSPQEVKLAVTGYGNAQKREVISMTKRLISGIDQKALDDEYDAVALALCALSSHRHV